ncbi:hypothetical protein NliqN6_0676 [Naganishia liquefaciens]|uniref:1-phosphatidylinositol-4-phosphate 5-kinase n=1 Tax=Naganishia liquefaciens TaxID=104408 RepID=A0A8H3TQ49_9TREE|nr:hypothetical protein NliqN6_0676 [Naganishia liquefaciens]
MTATTEIPSLPPLDFEEHESPSHHGLLDALHTHAPNLHGSPATNTAKSLTDQTAQMIGAFKRDNLSLHYGKSAGKGESNGLQDRIEKKVVTKVLDDPHAADVDGGIGRHVRSDDQTSIQDKQREATGPLYTGTSGSDVGQSVSYGPNDENIVNLRESSDSIKEESLDASLPFKAPQNGHAIVAPATNNQINPFHQLSFPDGSSPPWIAEPLSYGDPPTMAESALAPSVHIKRVSRDTVVLIPATPSVEQTSQTSGFPHEFMAQISHQDQQLELANGHLAIVENKEEKKAGLLGKFERALTKGATTHETIHTESAGNERHAENLKPIVSADFQPQGPSDHEANEVRGNAPPSPPISEPEMGPDAARATLSQPGGALFQASPNPFRMSAIMSDASAFAERLSQAPTLDTANEALSPRTPSRGLFADATSDDNNTFRSISGQSYTTEPEVMAGGEFLQGHALPQPSVNASTSGLPHAGNSDVSASILPNGTAPPAERNVVLAPPVLIGTTRSGSIAAIKRGAKGSSGTASGRNSVASTSVVDGNDREVSLASLQAGGRRMSSDRHSNKGRSSLDQISQNSLGLGIPSSSLQSVAGMLQGAPLVPPVMPERRNTTGGPSSPRITTRSPLISSQSQLQVPLSPGGSQSPAGGVVGPRKRTMTDVPGLEGSALDPDILAEADRLRKERLNRRQRKKSESEDEIARLDPESAAAGQLPIVDDIAGDNSAIKFESHLKQKERQLASDPDKVLVGNLIGEDHVNYVLMYNMLTGIRIAVSRCQAKMKRSVTESDYSAKHKYSFDIVGNELTPSARYDFKFKDYAPWIFRELREDYFHLDPADYLLSLTAKYILSELGSPGKSGSFFYFSRDYRFIIKTIHHAEHKYLRSILKDYHQHVKNNPHTLLSRFYGLHRVKLPRGRKIHFVIMNNLFPPHRDIHETYDLKGSAYGREYSEEKAKLNPKATLKDMNWLHRGRQFELGPEKRALFSEQLRRDTEFLKTIGVMDYSLLIGIHNMERGNRDNIRENQLSVFHPDVGGLVRRKPSSVKGNSEAAAVRKIVKRSDPKAMSSAIQELPTIDSTDRRHFLFYQDEGGLRATDEANRAMDIIYYLGVIDILTPYNTVKRLEHLWRGTTIDRHMISCVPPQEYGERFLRFLLSFMRGADTSNRPKME